MPELKILSEHYKVRANVVDIRAEDLITFGNEDSSREIFLFFNGGHYEVGVCGERKIFEIGTMTAQFVQLGSELKKKGQYINIQNMKYKCHECGLEING